MTEDQRLRELYADGAPLRVIAAEIGRSADAVGARRAVLGLAPRRTNPPWSALADAFLQETTAAGVPASLIAAKLHRRVAQIHARKRQLGLQRPPARRYTAIEDASIRAHGVDAARLNQLARELGRTPDAIRLRARTLGLCDAPSRRRWNAAEDATVHDGYTDGLTCEAIARSLDGRTATAVAARARKLGLCRYARRWDAEEELRLRRILALRPVEDAARLLDRTPEAIRQRARQLHIIAPGHDAPDRSGARWSADEDALLALHAALNPAALAVLLGRSDRAVAARLRRLGLRQGRERSPHHPFTVNPPARKVDATGGKCSDHRMVADRDRADHR